MSSPPGRVLARNIPALTGLRGAAAVVVVLYHYLEAPSLMAGHLRAPFSGYLGVDLFFVLSGFLMGLNYGKAFDGGFDPHTYLDFLGKRFARVYPLYAAITLALLALSHAGFFQLFVQRSVIAINFLAVQQLGPGLVRPYLGDSIVDGSWSISTELGAYLLFPLLYFLTCRSRSSVMAATAAVAWASVALLVFLPAGMKSQQLPAQGPLDLWSGWSLWPLIRCLSEFTIGLLTMRWVRAGVGPMLEGEAAGFAIVAVLIASVVIPGLDLLAVIAIALLVGHLALQRSSIARAFASSPMLFLGEVSYALYLLHLPVLDVVYRRHLSIFGSEFWRRNEAVALISSAVIAVALAYAAFRFIEAPARSVVRRLIALPPRQSVVQEPSAP